MINIAELAVVKEDFNSAFQSYNQAFKYTDEPKVIDLMNSLKCACLSKGEIDYNLVKQLLSKGLSDSDIVNGVIVKGCLKINKRDHEVKVIYDSLYRKEINDLGEKDQYFRLKTGSYKKYRKEIDSVDALNINRLLHLISTKGFPSETRIGVENIGGYQGWEIVLWHYQQQRSIKKNNKQDLFSDVLYDALRNGEITPLEFSIFIELQNDPKYLKYKTNPLTILEKGKYRVLKSILENIKQIDSDRKEVELEPLKDYIKKIVYQNDNKYNFYFGINNGYIDLRDQSKAVKKLLKEKTVQLDFKDL